MNIIILGNGITGTTTARFVRKQIPQTDAKITLISSESDYFFSRTALMYIYMGHMRLKDTQPYEPAFYDKNGIRLKNAFVTSVNTIEKTLHYQDGSSDSYDILVLATGSVPNRFGWPGENLKRVHGLYSLQDLEKLEEASKEGIQRAVIVGGGLIGIELAEMLHTRNIPVTMLVRESSYWNNILPEEESEIINKEIQKHHIDLRLSTELKEIRGNSAAEAVVTSDDEVIECNYVGLTAGVRPNLTVLADGKSGIETNRGIIVNERFETNAPDVYAAGDCAELKQYGGRVEQLWYTGRMQAEALGRIIAAKIRGKYPQPNELYERGVWFNSAKFFTIEYQTYGFVPARVEPHRTFVWQSGSKLFRILWNEKGEVTGFNLLSIRYRHAVCEQWIRDKENVSYVIDRLEQANFDPEFFKRNEKEIRKAFYKKHPEFKNTLKEKKAI